MSKWKKKSTSVQEKPYIYPHYHCIICEKIIEKGQKHVKQPIKEKGLEVVNRYCSQECYDKVHQSTKKSFWRKYLIWIIMAASIIILIIVWLLPK
ncbi:MAG: hypothetical protein ACTSPY_07485 [Candidatus Helarchaeota archaeon]